MLKNMEHILTISILLIKSLHAGGGFEHLVLISLMLRELTPQARLFLVVTKLTKDMDVYVLPCG